MLPRYDQPLALEEILRFRSDAKMLARKLQDELAALSLNSFSGATRFKEIYDAVYLPKAQALADGLAAFDIPDADLLRRPFSPQQASVQLSDVIGVLNVIGSVLSPH